MGFGNEFVRREKWHTTIPRLQETQSNFSRRLTLITIVICEPRGFLYLIERSKHFRKYGKVTKESLTQESNIRILDVIAQVASLSLLK